MRLRIPRPAAQAMMIDLGRAITGPLAPPWGTPSPTVSIDLPRARAFVDALGGVALPVALEVQDARPAHGAATKHHPGPRRLAAALVTTDPVEATRRHHHDRDRALWNLAAPRSADHALKSAGGLRVGRDERGDLDR